jgi:hypothetical protein
MITTIKEIIDYILIFNKVMLKPFFFKKIGTDKCYIPIKLLMRIEYIQCDLTETKQFRYQLEIIT